jgi:DNA-directed RNA polymerase specialized sigma24 family protein
VNNLPNLAALANPTSHLTTVADLRQASGDEVGAFFMAHVGVVEGTVRNFGARAEVAQDCASEAFLRLYQSYVTNTGRLGNPAVPARALWCTIARRQFVDQYRKQRGECTVDIWPVDSAFPDINVVVQYHLCEEKLIGNDSILAALHSGGYLLKEIAQAVGKSVSQTCKDLARVVQRLVECMEAA